MECLFFDTGYSFSSVLILPTPSHFLIAVKKMLETENLKEERFIMAHAWQNVSSYQAGRKKQRDGIANVIQTQMEPQLCTVTLSSIRNSLHLLDTPVHTNQGFVALMPKRIWDEPI